MTTSIQLSGLQAADLALPRLAERSVPASGVMIAKDAGATIAQALRSMRFCREIVVVVDERSSDETLTVAEELADRIEVRPWQGYGPTKQAAVDLAAHAWILMIDADEWLSPELAMSVAEAVDDADPSVAYQLRRRTRFLGRWMLHGDWGRDRVLRLFHRETGGPTADAIHESVQVEARKLLLKGLLYHEGDQTLQAYLERQNRYTTLAAKGLFGRGRRTTMLATAIRPVFKFLQSYILRLGFLDGWQGLVLAYYSAVAVFTKYAKLYALQHRQQRPDAESIG